MTVHQVARTLRATRRFSPDRVADELVNSWLETARWCGSSKNSQPWRFVVVRNRATLTTLAALGDHSSHLAEADLAIAIALVDYPFMFSALVDLGRVSQTLMLAAHADGVGSCIAVFEPRENIEAAREVLKVPETYQMDIAIGFGYACKDRPPVESMGPPGRRPIAEIVSHESFLHR